MSTPKVDSSISNSNLGYTLISLTPSPDRGDRKASEPPSSIGMGLQPSSAANVMSPRRHPEGRIYGLNNIFDYIKLTDPKTCLKLETLEKVQKLAIEQLHEFCEVERSTDKDSCRLFVDGLPVHMWVTNNDTNKCVQAYVPLFKKHQAEGGLKQYTPCVQLISELAKSGIAKPLGIKCGKLTVIENAEEAEREAWFLDLFQGHPNFGAIYNQGRFSKKNTLIAKCDKKDIDLKALDKEESVFFVEHCDSGDLFDFRASAGDQALLHLPKIALDATNALAYMHGMRIIHGDIKPHNIFLQSVDDKEYDDVNRPVKDRVIKPNGKKTVKAQIWDFGTTVKMHKPHCKTPSKNCSTRQLTLPLLPRTSLSPLLANPNGIPKSTSSDLIKFFTDPTAIPETTRRRRASSGDTCMGHAPNGSCSPMFLSPERAIGFFIKGDFPPTEQDDIFALGLTLYQYLSNFCLHPFMQLNELNMVLYQLMYDPKYKRFMEAISGKNKAPLQKTAYSDNGNMIDRFIEAIIKTDWKALAESDAQRIVDSSISNFICKLNKVDLGLYQKLQALYNCSNRALVLYSQACVEVADKMVNKNEPIGLHIVTEIMRGFLHPDPEKRLTPKAALEKYGKDLEEFSLFSGRFEQMSTEFSEAFAPPFIQGSLHSLVFEKDRNLKSWAAEIWKSAFEALTILHASNKVNGNICPKNLVIGFEGLKPKVTLLASPENNNTFAFFPYDRWEEYRNKLEEFKATMADDLWAMGICMETMLTNRAPVYQQLLHYLNRFNKQFGPHMFGKDNNIDATLQPRQNALLRRAKEQLKEVTELKASFYDFNGFQLITYSSTRPIHEIFKTLSSLKKSFKLKENEIFSQDVYPTYHNTFFAIKDLMKECVQMTKQLYDKADFNLAGTATDIDVMYTFLKALRHSDPKKRVELYQGFKNRIFTMGYKPTSWGTTVKAPLPPIAESDEKEEIDDKGDKKAVDNVDKKVNPKIVNRERSDSEGSGYDTLSSEASVGSELPDVDFD